jgi:hypothetical protein
MLRHYLSIIVIATTLLPAASLTAETDNKASAEIIAIPSADWLTVTMQGWPDIAGKALPVHVKGVNAPPAQGHCNNESRVGEKALGLTRSIVQPGDIVSLENMERGDGFYLEADVYNKGTHLNEQLLITLRAEKAASGESWCPPAKRASGKFTIKRN